MTSAEMLKDILWRVMREELCISKNKQEAKCIVLLTEHDVTLSSKALMEDPEFRKFIGLPQEPKP